MNEFVILVDENDEDRGVMSKIEVHEKGLLHRALSVFIFNSRNEILLQRRAESKYHSPLLWSNTCCSHPRPFEHVDDAAFRRLYEEMGIIADLNEVFSFVYRTEFENGLIEYEFDHVFIGRTDTPPWPNPAEVAEYKYVSCEWLQNDIKEQPELYTEWLKICINDWKHLLLK